MIPLVLILAIAALMNAARSFVTPGGAEPSSVGLAFGFLLLAAFFAGRFFARLHLPRLTGYLALGVVAGPAVLGLVTHDMTEGLKLVNGVAISLIALSAGVELSWRTVRPLLGAIAWLTGVAVLGTAALLAGVVVLLRGSLPFLATMPLPSVIAVAAVLGVVMAAQSPAVVIALREELAADGPVTRVVLGAVVLADLVVIVLFALVSSVAHAVMGGGASVGEFALRVAWELFGSLGAGLVVGLLLWLYVARVATSVGLFLLAVAVVVAEVGGRYHLDPLLVALSAGIFLENVAHVGERIAHEIRRASLSVYVVFFAVTGATIHLDVLATVWLPAIAFVLTRAGGFLVGARVAAKLAGAGPEVGRWAGFGLLPQAGLALALAVLFARTFPSFGEGASALTLGVVALNELVAPVLFRWALLRSGEAGRGEVEGGAEAPEDAAQPVTDESARVSASSVTGLVR